jgi:hypothetical protein
LVLPISIGAQFEKLDTQVKALKSELHNNEPKEKVAISVADIANSCALTLDKCMNAVWEKHNCKHPSKNKANVYFPYAISREKLEAILEKSQLKNLEEDAPGIFQEIEKCQVYSGEVWCDVLSKVTRIRHEYYPKISEKTSKSTCIGKGQNVYIEKMIITGGKISEFRGCAVNQKTGRAEQVKIDFEAKLFSVITDVDMKPLDLCELLMSKTKHTVQQIYRYL